VKIIAGKHKGRKLDFVRSKDLRPTRGRTKEAIFSILSSGNFIDEDCSVIEGAVVLDLFCGTGALGLEAISRGATKAIMVDIEPRNLESVQSNASNIREDQSVILIRADVRSLPIAKERCGLVFIDPPYFQKLASKALVNLLSKGWLDDGAVIVVEISRKEDLSVPEELEELSSRIYGNTKLVLLRKI
jgi:16S rRNA (guanine966-N2)-methyltransferase